MKPEPLRIGLIGAGRRMQGNYLPALFLLPDDFAVAWAHARRPEPLRAAMDPWGVAPQDVLDAAALESVDAVAMSVPIDQNAKVLGQLQAAKHRLHLFIDTPIVTSLKQARDVMPLLVGFRSVTVTEDFMNFPEWSLARSAVEEGVTGPVSDVILDGAGYYYHGLALIRSFFGFDDVRVTRRVALGGAHAVNTFEFAHGRRGRIAYPYRRFDGTMTVIGARRTISTCAGADDTRPVILLTRHRNAEGLIDRITLSGDGVERELVLDDVAAIAAMPEHDRSDLNLMRTLGLKAVFRSLRAPDINARYGLLAGLYDSIVSRRANRKSLVIDPLTYAKAGNMVKLLLR